MKTLLSLSALCLLTACFNSSSPKPAPPTPPAPPETGPIAKPSGSFVGKIEFIDPSCPKADRPRFCKLKNMHSFSTLTPKRTWQTVAWAGETDREIQSGTTNGADIPRLVWPLVGHPFDPKILPAAIIHDHYTFKENRTVNWYDTHLMYLHILLDQGLDPIKAYTQYFAVYTFGAHWTKTVKGEECVKPLYPCIKRTGQKLGQYHQESRLNTPQAAQAIQEVYYELNRIQGLTGETSYLTPAYIQDLARQYEPNNPFLYANGRDIPLTRKNRSWLSKYTVFIPKNPRQR